MTKPTEHALRHVIFNLLSGEKTAYWFCSETWLDEVTVGEVLQTLSAAGFLRVELNPCAFRYSLTPLACILFANIRHD